MTSWYKRWMVALELALILLAGCATPASEFEHTFDKADDPACVAELELFFRRYANVGGDFGDYWTAEHFSTGGARIEYSWEFEGSSELIVKYYRPREIEEIAWRRLTIGERTERAKSLVRDDPWADFVRMEDAPEFMRANLASEGKGIWETTSDTYVTTMDGLFDQALFVNTQLGKSGNPGFHWHVSFEPAVDDVDKIIQFTAQANEFVTLRMFRMAASNIHHSYLGPYDTQRLSTMSDLLKQLLRGDTSLEYTAGDKFSSFSIRTGLYGDPSRIGFEVRAINRDLDDARRAVSTSTRFLENPDEARLAFGPDSPGYTLRDIATVDRLGAHTVDRLPAQLRTFVDRAVEAAPRKPTRQYSNVDPNQELLERWAMPLVQWEERSYFPEEIQRRVVTAREVYLRGLSRLADTYEGRAPGAEAQTVIEELVHSWAQTTNLHRFF